MGLNERQFAEHGIETIRPGMVNLHGRPTPAAAHVRYGDSDSSFTLVPQENGGLSYVAHVPNWDEGKQYEVGWAVPSSSTFQGKSSWSTSVREPHVSRVGDPHEALRQHASIKVSADDAKRNSEFMRHTLTEDHHDKWWNA